MKHRRRHLPLRHLPVRLPGPSAGLRIGLIGGSFDPPHSGHLHLIEIAHKRLGLDWIWVIPAAGNPLKQTKTAFRDRFDAAERALTAHPRVRVSPIEAKLGLAYTIDLVRVLKRRAPGSHFVWIIGGDNLGQFHRWRAWREIARLIPIAVVSRRSAGPTPRLSRFARAFAASRLPAETARQLASKRAPAWVYLPAPLDPTSSSELRAKSLAASFLPPL